MSKTIKRVVHSAAIDGGHAIHVELEYTDRSRETLRCDMHNAPNLVQALMQAAQTADQMQKMTPAQVQEMELVASYRVAGFKVGAATDQSAIAIRFSTLAGVPLEVSMPPNLARDAIQSLTEVVEGLGTQPPPRKN